MVCSEQCAIKSGPSKCHKKAGEEKKVKKKQMAELLKVGNSFLVVSSASRREGVSWALSCWRHSAWGGSVLMKGSAPGRARLPVREALGLALGNRISLHHPREAPHPALREREGLAFCPGTSPAPGHSACSHPAVRTQGRARLQGEGADTGRTDRHKDRI